MNHDCNQSVRDHTKLSSYTSVNNTLVSESLPPIEHYSALKGTYLNMPNRVLSSIMFHLWYYLADRYTWPQVDRQAKLSFQEISRK